MQTIYLEQRGSTNATEHNKFYRITDDGARVITEWGSIGHVGKSKVLITSPDVQKRAKSFKSQLNKKLKKNYIPINKDGKQIESRPTNEGRKWGVEIETHSRLRLNDIVEKMQTRKLLVNKRQGDYFKSNGRQWDVKRDGSCGYEFASPILSGEAGFFEAKLAVEKIREVCPTATNDNCGLHVTIDVSDHSTSDLKKLIIGYLLAQEYFYAECNDTRQRNEYCLKNPTNRIKDIIYANGLSHMIELATPEGRYHGLNLSRLREKRIVEFRMMESTVGIRKVGGWIRLCVSFIDGLKKSDLDFTKPMSVEAFKQYCE